MPRLEYSLTPNMGTVRGRREIEQIREAVLLEALDLRIPLSRENITVEKEVNYVFISLNYVVPIILPWGEFHWELRNHRRQLICFRSADFFFGISPLRRKRCA